MAVTDLLTLLESDTPLRRVSSTNGGEYAGPCPFCGGYDRFRVWPGKGRYWCRGCGRSGDAIQYLRDFYGLSFTEARRALGMDIKYLTSEEIRQKRAHHKALETARSAFETWSYWKLQKLADEHIQLLVDLGVVESAYRLLYYQQEPQNDGEQEFFETELIRVYDRLPVLKYQLDLLTFKENEDQRFEWWQEEEEQ